MNTAKYDEKALKAFMEDNYARDRFDAALLSSLSPLQVAMLGCCMYYEDALQAGIARGEKWVYTNCNDFAYQRSTFDHMVESGKHGTNCAMPAGWAFIDMGMLEEGQRFWGNKEGEIAHYDQLGEALESFCHVYEYSGESFSDIFAAGRVRPGDVFMGKGHTFIYLCDNLFLAAGHDGKWHKDDAVAPFTEDAKHACFDSWINDFEHCSNYSYRVFRHLSLKEDFIPEFYRNKAGQIVKNPLYRA